MRIKLRIRKEKDINGEWWLYWHLSNRYHKIHTPAYQDSSGHKTWRLFGKLHNDAGPAIIWADGIKSFYANEIWIKNEN